MRRRGVILFLAVVLTASLVTLTSLMGARMSVLLDTSSSMGINFNHMMESHDLHSYHLLNLIDNVTLKLSPVVLRATTQNSNQKLADRQAKIRHAMAFAWSNYRDHAWGADELLPVIGGAQPSIWGGLAMTMVDALDTLWIMGFKEEFDIAKRYIADLKFEPSEMNQSISVFEAFIRVVGGLLGAYSVSQERVFLQKAEEVVKLLDGAWDEKAGVYHTYINPAKNERRMFADIYKGNIADLGSLQLESRFLSQETKNPIYAERGDRFLDIIRTTPSYNNTGLYPRFYNAQTKMFENATTLLTIGAYTDSFYEYLVKVWSFSGKSEDWLRNLYDHAVDGIKNVLTVTFNDTTRAYLNEIHKPYSWSTNTMQDLTCFVPGMLAYGTLHTPPSSRKSRDLKLAKAIGQACYDLNVKQPAGLIPIETSLLSFQTYDGKHRLRPETIESLYYLYTVTKNETYRDMGWKLFESIETHCKSRHGYSELLDVRRLPSPQANKMESYFLAETLKYHYLLQSPRGGEMLDYYVFNTEAHPMKIKQRDQ